MPANRFSIANRFREARERAGLSIAETARRAGISEACVWDLETDDNELTCAYSPADLQRFAAILNIRPAELLGVEMRSDPITAGAIISTVQEHCRTRAMTIDQFCEVAGWDITAAMASPELLLSAISIDGSRDVCRAVGVEWERVISAL
jgi:DNA-binding XRE family transcriptional regulator